MKLRESWGSLGKLREGKERKGRKRRGKERKGKETLVRHIAPSSVTKPGYILIRTCF